jgi:hypothetical protein
LNTLYRVGEGCNVAVAAAAADATSASSLGSRGTGMITLPQSANTLWIQLNQFFELNILDAELLDQEGENTLFTDMPKLEAERAQAGRQGGVPLFSFFSFSHFFSFAPRWCR